MIKIVLLGAGNMATQLCLNFHKNGNPILQLYNRTLTKAHLLKNYVNSLTDKIEELTTTADVYIISVSDNSIEEISNRLLALQLQPKAIIVHTSGNTTTSILTNHNNTGVFYPLQSVRSNDYLDFKVVPILITTDEAWIQEFLIKLGRLISDKTKVVSDEYRSKLHIPAVIVNNFTNYLYHIAYDYCQKENLDFSLLKPLIAETAQRIVAGRTPSDVQTGPAVRGDKRTIIDHKTRLKRYPNKILLYNYLSKRIQIDLLKG